MDGKQLIREFEGLRLKAYLCPAGIPTIGYGHTRGVRLGQTITQEQAEQFLEEDYNYFKYKVYSMVTVPINVNQQDALISFAFNLGEGALRGSTLLRKLNNGDYVGAANEFQKWVYSKNPKTGVREILPGIERRRKAEKDLFQRSV